MTTCPEKSPKEGQTVPTVHLAKILTWLHYMYKMNKNSHRAEWYLSHIHEKWESHQATRFQVKCPFRLAIPKDSLPIHITYYGFWEISPIPSKLSILKPHRVTTKISLSNGFLARFQKRAFYYLLFFTADHENAKILVRSCTDHCISVKNDKIKTQLACFSKEMLLGKN